MSKLRVNNIEDLAGVNRPLPLGVGQTWQNMTAQRQLDTDYTNTTGRTIVIAITKANNTNGTNITTITVDGVQVWRHWANHAGQANGVGTAIVPPGSVYRVGGSALEMWAELR